jgi:hypothetical protein
VQVDGALQELLAPASVEFFSREGHELQGWKQNLTRIIHSGLITGNLATAFQETHPLSTFSIAERFSRSHKRSTTRLEDKVYSLLGVFDIYMLLMYGEGKDKAVAIELCLSVLHCNTISYLGTKLEPCPRSNLIRMPT